MDKELSKYNNLLELFIKQYQSEKKDEIFLQSLKNVNLRFTWKQTFDSIQKLSNYLMKYTLKIDACLFQK